MRNMVLTIQYDGSRYDGWQKQGNTPNTIQGRFEALLSRMTNEDVELHGSGRTDAGVHAMGQTANFRTECDMTIGDIFEYINRYLPRDIAVTDIREGAPRFHARLNAKRKHYRYRIRTSAVPDVFTRRYVWEMPEKLNINAMKKAAEELCGRHDFTSFCDNKRMKKSAVRSIERIDFTEKEGELILDFYGDGFLYHMIRILVGTLVDIGCGREYDLPNLLDSKNRSLAGPLAPAQGLCLMEVFYD